MAKDNRTDAQVLREGLRSARKIDDRFLPGLCDAVTQQMAKAAKKAERAEKKGKK